ncbi:MAG TPA: MFS transporter [Gaiellaceae bacterium]
MGPLRRHRDFRLLLLGRGVSFLGAMVTYVAIPYQVYHLSGSSLLVGLLGLAELGPLLATAFLGGAFADAFDRRRMVQLTELALAGASGVLLLNAALSPRVWVLFVVAAVMAALDGLQRPSLEALEPRLVERDELPSAGALSSLVTTAGMIGGPALGGGLIAAIGLPATYGFDVATFAVSLGALRLMRAVPPPPDAERPSLRGIAEGFRYARGRPELLGTYGVDMVAMFFGMPNALFPALAVELGGGATLVGLLYAAPAVGALLATATSGWVSRINRHGAAVCIAATGWGVGIVVVGLAPGVVLALVGLVVAGFADMVSGIFRGTIWNQTIPDRLRGRLAGIEQVSYSTGPLLGNVEAGVVAAVAGVRASIVSGGVLCIAGVAVAAALLPAFRRYEAAPVASGA